MGCFSEALREYNKLQQMERRKLRAEHELRAAWEAREEDFEALLEDETYEIEEEQ